MESGYSVDVSAYVALICLNAVGQIVDQIGEYTYLCLYVCLSSQCSKNGVDVLKSIVDGSNIVAVGLYQSSELSVFCRQLCFQRCNILLCCVYATCESVKGVGKRVKLGFKCGNERRKSYILGRKLGKSLLNVCKCVFQLCDIRCICADIIRVVRDQSVDRGNGGVDQSIQRSLCRVKSVLCIEGGESVVYLLDLRVDLLYRAAVLCQIVKSCNCRQELCL